MTKYDLLDKLQQIVDLINSIEGSFEEEDCILKTEDQEWLLSVSEEFNDLIDEYV